MEKIIVTLKRSLIGETPRVRQCVQGLGLRRIRQSRELEDTPSVRGMIFKARHLLAVSPPEAAHKRLPPPSTTPRTP